MERVRTTNSDEAEKLAKKGIPVDLVDDIKEKKSKKRPDYPDIDGDGDREEPMSKAFKDKKQKIEEMDPKPAEKEYGQSISNDAFKNLPVGKIVQYKGATSPIKSNNGYNIELEDGTRFNYNMFNTYGRIPHEDENPFKDNIKESHTGNPKDKYVVRPCKNKKEPWAVWEGEIRVKGFATKAEAKKYADKKNKKQTLKKVAEICLRKGMNKPQIAEVLKKYQANSDKSSCTMKEQDFLGPDNKDYEGEMAKSQMLKMKKYAVALCDMIEDETQLEAWVQAKLTKASEYMSAVYHYLDYQASQSNETMVGSKPETDLIFIADKNN